MGASGSVGLSAAAAVSQRRTRTRASTYAKVWGRALRGWRQQRRREEEEELRPRLARLEAWRLS
jgi:hypothetical protein